MEGKKKRKKLYRKSIEKKFLKKRFEFRLSEVELAELKKFALESGLTQSEYARRIVLQKKGPLYHPKELIDSLHNNTREINKVGVNINQATNFMNHLRNHGRGSGKEISEFDDLFHKYLVLLDEMNNLLKSLIRRI